MDNNGSQKLRVLDSKTVTRPRNKNKFKNANLTISLDGLPLETAELIRILVSVLQKMVYGDMRSEFVNLLYSEPSWPQACSTISPRHENVYDLSKHAYVLVLHHDKFKDNRRDRHGSFKDMEKIKQLLQYYRCGSLDINENRTKRNVQRKMKGISTKDFTDYSCLIVFIMSHGALNDTIMAYDGAMYCFQRDIVEQCTANRTLNGKPKIFVLQACRGDASIVTDAVPVSMSHKSDIIIFHSSYQGAVSYRNVEEGSFFMQAFLRLMHQHNKQNIMNINTLLNREFKAKSILQTPTMVTTLQKKLIFGDLLL